MRVFSVFSSSAVLLRCDRCPDGLGWYAGPHITELNRRLLRATIPARAAAIRPRQLSRIDRALSEGALYDLS